MNSYTVKSRLGQGAFSTVYKVLRKQDNIEYAMKKIRILSLSDKETSNCLNEVRILASIEHPNIVSYKDSFYDELTSTFCIVTELVEGGDVANLIMKNRAQKTQIKQEFIWKVAQQVLEGLKSLHELKILHRDIKSANIFLTKNHQQAKLGDMNVSIVSNNGMAKTQTGTPYYASPEVWKQQPYNLKCDIWSLGCVLYEMAALRPPFESKDLKSLKKTIMAGVYKRIPTQYSNQLEEFIRLCLKVKAQQRYAAQDLLNSWYLQKRNKPNKPQSLQRRSSLQKLIQKIQVPKKRQFKIIKGRLPQNKFTQSLTKSSNTISQNNSHFIDSNKENITIDMNSIQIQTGKVQRKTQLNNSKILQNTNKFLPSVVQSQTRSRVKSIFQRNQKQLQKCAVIPNIPKPRLLRY